MSLDQARSILRGYAIGEWLREEHVRFFDPYITAWKTDVSLFRPLRLCRMAAQPGWSTTALHVAVALEDGSLDYVSWRQAIKGANTKYGQVICALRKIAEDGMPAVQHGKHRHHKVSFKTIVNEWALFFAPCAIEDLEVEPASDWGRKLKDPQLARSFRDYHAQRAVIEFLTPAEHRAKHAHA